MKYYAMKVAIFWLIYQIELFTIYNSYNVQIMKKSGLKIYLIRISLIFFVIDYTFDHIILSIYIMKLQ